MGESFHLSKLPAYMSIGIRMIVTAIGAWLLMLVISFPSALVAQEPLITLPHIDHAFLLEWKDWLWVAPWLLMEIAAMAGPRRNLVWFGGLLGCMAVTAIAYPIIQSTRPELIHPHFHEWVHATSLKEDLEQISILAENSPYRDKCLSYGFTVMWALVGLSVFLRVVVLSYFMKISTVRDENEINSVDVEDISPNAESARTVKEIAADAQKVKPDFKFGEADHGLVAHLRDLLQRMQYLRTLKGICWLSTVLVIILWFFLYPQPNEQQALERDLTAMYETTTDAAGNEIGTNRAVHAALRVMKFATDNRCIDNMSVADAEKWLRLDQAPEAYRATIRNENIGELEFLPDRLRTNVPYARFLTITDGRHHAVMVLNLRTNEMDPATDAPMIQPDTPINFPQFFEFGWDKEQDLRRSYPYLYEAYQFNNAVWM